MKSLKACDTINDLRGEPIMIDSEPVRVKDILIQYLIGYQGKEPKKIILSRKVAQKLFDHKVDKMDLEDAEFDLIKEAIKDPKHPAITMAPVLEAIEEAEKEE
jgi:hypothetical protein